VPFSALLQNQPSESVKSPTARLSPTPSPAAVLAPGAGRSRRNAQKLPLISLVVVATAILLAAYRYWDAHGTTAKSGTTLNGDGIGSPDILKTTTGDTSFNTATLLGQSEIWRDYASGLLTMGAINVAAGDGNQFTVPLMSTDSDGTTLADFIGNAASEPNKAAPTINTTNGTTDTYTGIPVNLHQTSHGFRHAIGGHTRHKRRPLRLHH
jgi:hypothetical protein